MTHLSSEALSHYLDDTLPGEERQQVELHLASCRDCRHELTGARRLQHAYGRGRRIRVIAPLAAAAAILLFVVGIPREGSRPTDVRSGSAADQRLGVVAPVSATEVGPGEIGFEWRSAGIGTSYSLTLQESDGRVVWTTVVSDTVALLPDSVALAPGRTWFWSVDALLPDGRALSTGLQRLRTQP